MHTHILVVKNCCSNSLITPFSHFLLINFSKLQLRCCVRGYSYSAVESASSKKLRALPLCCTT